MNGQSDVHTGKFSENKPRGLYFSNALFKGLIFGGAYIRRGLSTEGNLRVKIDWASLIVGSKFTIFALFYSVFEGNFPSTSPPPGGGGIFGVAIQRRGFCLTDLGGFYLEELIHGGAYFRNFMVD